MRSLVSLSLLLFLLGCGESQPLPVTPLEQMKASGDPRQEAAAAKMERMAAAMEASKAEEQAILDRIERDREGELFPRAEADVLASAKRSIGNTAAMDATIRADAIEDFGDKEWEVVGEYRGPDRNGKEFKSRWTVKLSLFAGKLQTISVKLGQMKYGNE